MKDEVGKVKSGDEMVRKANEQKKTEQTFVSSPSPDILSFPENEGAHFPFSSVVVPDFGFLV